MEDKSSDCASALIVPTTIACAMRMAHSWIVLWQNEPTASQNPVKKIAAPGSESNQFLPVSSAPYIAQKNWQGQKADIFQASKSGTARHRNPWQGLWRIGHRSFVSAVGLPIFIVSCGPGVIADAAFIGGTGFRAWSGWLG
jgi:hypothetical protein